MSTYQRQSFFDTSILSKFSESSWLASILEKALPSFHSKDDYITLKFFKDGVPKLDYPLSDFEDILKNNSNLTSLPFSFRLSNCQKLSVDILKMCSKLDNHFNKTFTCNLYYTPGANKNCFNFHVDHQYAYIFQIFGEKEWIFPLENGACLEHNSNVPFDFKLMEGKPVEKILLSSGDQLYVPFGLVHKAEIQSEGPSLHLTFGTSDVRKEDFIQAYVAFCLDSAGLSKNIKLPVEGDQREIIQKFHQSIANSSLEEFLKIFEEKSFGDKLLLTKFGRSYKTSAPVNQD